MTLHDLPAVNASLNGLSAVFLTGGYVFIRRGNKRAHRNCMLSAVVTSTLFLICYVVYHSQVGHTTFQNPAWFRPYYLLLLASHVILAVVIVPLVIITLVRGLKERIAAHKKIARWTWPLWIYVSVTGVLVYLILYKIFPQSSGQ
jgi:putative membrane protein